MMRTSKILSLLLFVILQHAELLAHRIDHVYGENPGQHTFDSFEDVWPTPTAYRTASGKPGPEYWQQQADYKIKIRLDDESEKLIGEAEVTYTNNSPHTLEFIWVQLDQNALDPESASRFSKSFDHFENNNTPDRDSQGITFETFRETLYRNTFKGGYNIKSLTDEQGRDLEYKVVGTVMRIDVNGGLKPSDSFVFNISWENNIVSDSFTFRHGVERLKKDNAPVYIIAQWYPRMCAYSDATGWQILPYLSSGEFALEFGDHEVEISVPEHFVVAATGELQNPDEILTEVQKERLEASISAKEPVMIVTPDEAEESREKAMTVAADKTVYKTWIFKAENVRDFAWAASPAYIWDSKGIEIDGETCMAMSVYPQEAAPIWQRYSTEAVAATVEGYSKYVYPYPYPVAWSCYGPVGGMEYPMLSFQSGKAEDDGTYPLSRRNYVIGVIVHEVGHNWFPMIINSDERKWMWLDEGLNSFVERLVAMEFDPVIRRSYLEKDEETLNLLEGKTDEITMLQADSTTQRGFSAYRKPELGLMMLRESIIGPEEFDKAMREYGKRWAFKRPIPADFFRTMEDVTGLDLDWFWRGWFYGNSACDRAIKSVVSYQMDPSDLAEVRKLDKKFDIAAPTRPWDSYLLEQISPVEAHEHLHDFYYKDDPFSPNDKELKAHNESIEKLKPWEKKLLDNPNLMHLVEIENVGGLILPMDLKLVFEDGSNEEYQIPAQIWSRGAHVVRIPFFDTKKLDHVVIDSIDRYRDRDLSNNRFPRVIETKRFHLKSRNKDPNRMQDATVEEETEE